MCPLPVDPDARKRLQDAQRAEAEALKAVELATRVRDRVQRKLDQANASLIAAELGLSRSQVSSAPLCCSLWRPQHFAAEFDPAPERPASPSSVRLNAYTGEGISE